MKILQVVQKPQRRGAEIFAFQLSGELRRCGHDVRIAYLYPNQGPNALPLQKTDDVLNGQDNHPFEKFPGVHPRLLNRLLQLIDEFQPDVVQVNGARTVKYGAFARYFYRNRPWRLVYRNIGNPKDWVRGWRHRLFYRRLVMPRIDGIVGVSQATLQTVRDFYHLSVPMTHIPRGVDPTALIPAQSREAIRHNMETLPEAPLLLFVGSLTPEKRPDRLLRVVCQVLTYIPNLQVWLVGDGPLRLILEQQVQSLGLVNTVRFLGVQTNVTTYMNAADLLLLTSDTEGIPGVILEAGWLGLPVVSTRVGGTPECILDKETGILVKPENEIGLIQAVLILLQDPIRRVEMGNRAKEWIRINFMMEKITCKYVDFYQKVRAV